MVCTDELTKAYIAGFIDGEGSVGVRKHKERYHIAVVSVTNTRRGVLDDIQAIYGGHIHAKPTTNPAWKVAYCLYLNSKKAADLLRDIVPYLRVKKVQAELVLDLCRGLLGVQVEKGVKGWRRLPQEEIERRDTIVDKLKELNRRGKS